MKVRYTLPALADLESVLAYLAEHSPQGLRRVQASFGNVERLLARHPHSGAQTRLAWLRRIRTAPFPYLIFYEVADAEIVIHAVRHAARDPASMPDAS